MAILPEPIDKLIHAFERLPGIGSKTASRLAFFMLGAPDEISNNLGIALKDIKSMISTCQECFNITTAGNDKCAICQDTERSMELICVVEEPLDVIAMERTGGFAGKYHVLQGALSPIEGIGPEKLRIEELVLRVRSGVIKEVIVATNPSMEGDATALFIRHRLEEYPLKLTRLARGLPVGGDLEYADQGTLLRALSGRQEL